MVGSSLRLWSAVTVPPLLKRLPPAAPWEKSELVRTRLTPLSTNMPPPRPPEAELPAKVEFAIVTLLLADGTPA
jgi:hypothetical protein